ncbi:MAG: hypothetical protein RLZZ319_103, partial [Actinomycetota bacterium]
RDRGLVVVRVEEVDCGLRLGPTGELPLAEAPTRDREERGEPESA